MTKDQCKAFAVKFQQKDIAKVQGGPGQESEKVLEKNREVSKANAWKQSPKQSRQVR
ncbi:hypothetical protein MMC24_005091 [Lignoscripta atroalba]|nr:hypothetical protein [Lignoscripta atroalba]